MKIQVSLNGRHFVDENNKPLFWLADTAWNAATRGDEADWDLYLSTRKNQGFNVIQFLITQWRGCSQPVGGKPYTIEEGKLIFHEEAWEYLDRWFAAIRSHRLIAAPVMLWGVMPTDPGVTMTDEQAIELCKRQLDRWDGDDVVWFLGGDVEHRTPLLVERWKRIGGTVFADRPNTIATLHPNGTSWAAEWFANESWYSFVGYQSGHGYKAHDLRRLTDGPYSNRWRNLEKPFLNLEPCYELATPYERDYPFSPQEIRRNIWWSLLGAPTAGVTYGNSCIWIWPQTDNEQAEGHDPSWRALKWSNGLETTGIENLKTLQNFLLPLRWNELLPANDFLVEQPGDEDPNLTIKLSCTQDQSLWLAYLPAGGPLHIGGFDPETYEKIRWWSPSTGDYAPATPEKSGRDQIAKYNPPSDDTDWIWIAEH